MLSVPSCYWGSHSWQECSEGPLPAPEICLSDGFTFWDCRWRVRNASGYNGKDRKGSPTCQVLYKLPGKSRQEA